MTGTGATTLHPCLYHKNFSDEGLKCKLSLLPEKHPVYPPTKLV